MNRVRTLLAMLTLLPTLACAELRVVIVEGLGGEASYASRFAEQVQGIQAAMETLTAADNVTVFHSGDFSRDDVLRHFGRLAKTMNPDDSLALFLIGHGSYDDHEYKFNISGPDLTDGDLARILDDTPGAIKLLVDTSSASGVALERLRGDGRILIAATKSGVERNATRFGDYFVLALEDSNADLDKNRIISAEEAFLYAERQVGDFYQKDGRMATEHARLEGDAAARFSLARLDAGQPAPNDAVLSGLLAKRAALNGEIEVLRPRRASMTPDDYQAALLARMLELATLEEQIEQREKALSDEE